MNDNASEARSSTDSNPAREMQDTDMRDEDMHVTDMQDRDSAPAPILQPTPTVPTRPTGPNPLAIIFGLVAMLLAGLIITEQARGLQVDWSRLGPGAIVGIGVVMAVTGAIGLVRRRDHL